MTENEYREWLKRSFFALGRYYPTWAKDTEESALFCESMGKQDCAENYRMKSRVLKEVITEFEEAK